MSGWVVLVAAVLLSLERLCYVYIARCPDAFRALCSRPAVAYLGSPIEVVQKLFYGFKGLQFAVFFGWCVVHGHAASWPLRGDLLPFGVGVACIVAGQMLNLSVFYRLGQVGVFYGNRLGYDVPWCRAFPFSLLKHPQYIGTVLSIWGFFLVLRFPHHDWYLIPTIETVYYALGAYFEQ
jgi:methylene-fatty-acyl-phospholipid synthase